MLVAEWIRRDLTICAHTSPVPRRLC